MKIYEYKVEPGILCENCRCDLIAGGDDTNEDFAELDVNEIADLIVAIKSKYKCNLCKFDFDDENKIKDAIEQETQDRDDTERDLNNYLFNQRR